MAEDERLQLTAAHAGRTLQLSLERAHPASELRDTLAAEFQLAPDSVKLVVRGKKLALAEAGPEPIGELLPSTPGQIKALVVGTKASALNALKDQEDLRRRKYDAFMHHQQHRMAAQPLSSARIRTIGGDDPSNYRFHHLEPFPRSVPFHERRAAMLERLAEDLAVRDVMKRHKFAVGVL